MKNLLILAILLLTFSFVNAQSKIYNSNGTGSYRNIVGYFEDGKIYNSNGTGSYRNIVGYSENGKIYNSNGTGSYRNIVGYYEGGSASAAAAIILLL